MEPVTDNEQWLPEERKARWPRLLLPLVLTALVAGAGYGGWIWLTDPHRLPIRSVKVGGELRHMDPRDMERALGALAEGNFFTVDVQAIRTTALRLPWVGKAGVRKVWPDILVVEVEERRPFARWGGDGLVTQEGVSFRPKATEIPGGLPWLAGPAGSEREVIERYRQLLPKFQALGLELITVTLDGRRSWNLGFRNGLVVKAGRQGMDERLSRFIRAYPLLSSQQRGAMQQVDLRYTNGFAVRWADSPKPPKTTGRKDIGERGRA